ncbi:putative Na(+)/H(+) antiporter subunit F [Microlunatus phosphovorus NM-1]|uniref:Putative Na(+)/H(+) antiporter subunit F n=1 Tax=Microlunatus phosphovorus (strain ATCC 700054 / DSM 10555 / JCM 9379 / NBRC 101784 / NCIMB 13414 / VKM Ac-1990 / NM-1) TaxID=1032480 RepID=F5XP09_MICPN|nr:monovalent cation/H+ antiporter complex subunit F [Microlunatus phosphovorus]BAK36649.1 putative Na(+)/H(+) antiporter subunit F [Microlunatus phosphovorus NM-1]
MTGAASVIIMIGVAFLAAAMALTLVRMTRGPSTLDRVIAADVVVAVVIAALAMEAALNHHTTTIPIMVVLSLLGFAGSLSMAKFAADRDRTGKWRDAAASASASDSSAQGGAGRRESESDGSRQGASEHPEASR